MKIKAQKSDRYEEDLESKGYSVKRLYIVLLITLLYLFSRLLYIGFDILNSDGSRWYRRSSNFLNALINKDFIQTYQHYQPGVVLMWIRGVLEQTTHLSSNFLNRPQWYLENHVYFSHIHTISKASIVLLLFLLFSYQLFIVKKLYGNKTAVAFGFLISIEPYLIGIDRWFHLTSLEVYFSFSAFLTILYWSKKNLSNKYLITSGVLLALSILSKVTAIITLIPILAVMMEKFISGKSSIYKTLRKYLIFSVSLILVIFALFPALWVDTPYVYNKISKAIFSATGLSKVKTPQSIIHEFIYYPVVLLYKLSPLTLFLFILGAIQSFIKKDKYKLHLLIYLSIYYFVLSISTKKIDRYSISFFPALILIAACFIGKLNNKIKLPIAVGISIVTLYALFNNFPVMSSFYSPIIGGEKSALKNGYYDNSGEYFAQAAFYLNDKKTYQVFVPNNFETFKYFYKGETTYNFDGADYELISKDTSRKVANNKYCNNLEMTFGPKLDPPVVYLYKCNK